MLKLNSISVAWRLAILAAIALACLLIVAVGGGLALRQSADVGMAVTDRQVPTLRALSDLQGAVGNLRRFEKDMFLHTGDPQPIAKYQARWRSTLDDARKHIQKLEPLLNAEQRGTLGDIASGLTAYGQGVEGIATRLLKGDFADAVMANKAMEPLKGDVRQLDDKLIALEGSVEQAVHAEREAMMALMQRQTVLQTGVVVVATLLLVAAAVAVVRSITRPLAVASHALERLAAGDLSHTVQSEGRDELAQMMGRLAQTQASLRTLVQTIHDHAQSVATASTQIAQGNSDLSVRTEQQAASLQETAASMEQLTGTVRSGADHAGQAKQIAQSASGAAQLGGEVVGRVVQTMSDIQSASRQIAEITGVIDGIAFQTNILALNAAVEAARAGEQGRGFAVVASEVRVLAQRSADAARQIKSLIAASVERVEAGHQLVQSAGGTMGDVVEQVRRVSSLMEGISASTDEQSRGIEQVSQAVGQLDQVTQQNAALVEESAAAAESLREQSRQLAAAVAAFRLGEGVAA